MTTKMKGLLKSFKFISQIFVYKEHEMEIGYPTDVKHVTHIGWDSSSLNAPSWMSEFGSASDFSSSSLSNFGQSRETSWASQDFDQPRGNCKPSSVISEDCPRLDLQKAIKSTKAKNKRSKTKTSMQSSSSRSIKSEASYVTAMDEPDEYMTDY